jgi:hypothetical protein
MPGTAADGGPFPDSVLFQEQTNIGLDRYAKTPVFLYYDSDVEGHGSRPDSLALLNGIRKAGGSIESDWLNPPDQHTQWGVREVSSIEKWMAWISAQSANRSTLQKARPNINANAGEVTTVKEAILGGFSIESSAKNSAFIKQWASLLSSYRGEEPHASSSANCTKIVERGIDDQLMAEILSGKLSAGAPQLPLKTLREADIDRSTTLWGFRMLDSPAQGKIVEILTNAPEELSPPKIDLLVEGCCRAAVWKRSEHRWVLFQVWL